jgi:hypothetical protein
MNTKKGAEGRMRNTRNFHQLDFFYLGDPFFAAGILRYGLAAMQGTDVEGGVGYTPRCREEEERRTLSGSSGGGCKNMYH